MSDREPRNLAELQYEIEFGLAQVRANPANITLHQELRRASLAYKAAGGRGIGFLEGLQRAPSEPLDRLLFVERRWAFDPGNLDHAVKLLGEVAALQTTLPEVDFTEVMQWIRQVLDDGLSGSQFE